MAMVGDHMKEVVVDQAPKRIKELQFGILSSREIVQQSVVQVSDRNSYDVLSTGTTRKTTRHGPLDARLGVAGKVGRCETCGQEIKDCNGHFGHVKLALPCFHIGYLKMIIEVLYCICKECSQVLLDEDQKHSYLKSLRRPGLDNLQRSAIYKRISAECRKRKRCPYCGATNGPVRKVPSHPMKIIHMKFDAYLKSTAKSKGPPPGKNEFDKSFEVAMQSNPEIEKHIKRAVDDINPLRALNLFREISDTDVELMGMDPAKGRPEMFIWTYVPAPPNTIRPSVAQDSATTDDDLTNKLGEIVWVSSLIRAGLERGQPIQTIMEQWDFLQLQLAMYINSDVPGLKDPGAKHIRGFCQRLKGKQGRFRGNLSGKRVDFSGRTVIGPDPNLGIDEVAVPERVATNLTYPERVTKNNKSKLQDCVRKGKKHPGANIVIKKNGRKIMLEVLARLGQEKLDAVANELQIGDVVERHLIDGDIVLFNRQPSLHKLSILSHRAKIRPWRTFRLNECVCNPYNADFDGDEMNLHVPQTEEARAEAIELMGVKHNLATPKNGTPIIAAIQDFITAAYLVSSKNNFYDRKTFAQIVGFMFNAASYKDPDTGELMTYELPPPVIWKPVRLWTGKQVFNVLMRPSKECKVLVNLDAKCKVHTPSVGRAPDMDEDDGYLVIRNSEVMCGVMDKATVGDGKKDSVFYVIMRDFGPDYAVQAMNRLAKLSARWLTNQGFSIGISDVYPSARLEEKKQEIVEKAYAECDDLIAQFKAGKLQRDPGCDEEQTMENKISGLLSKVRQDAGKICMSELSRWNAPLIMAKCGSKGSEINVSQMVAGVGQQMIGGKRVVDGFQDRTLPHFPKGTRRPAAKGFVANSFFSGLAPYEFIFHAMSGREGLVDTAVKTAETGYMSRRLIKSLEDLSVQYDDTVRNSSSGIVQFQYGDDRLDPVDMEGDAKPVHFNRTFTQAMTTTWDNEDRSLLPFQIRQLTKQLLEKRRSRLVRTSLRGETLDMKDKSDYGRDQFDSERDFMDTVEEFLTKKADKLAAIHTMLGMNAADIDDEDRIDWTAADEGKPINTADGIAKISESALTEFIRLCLSKYERSVVQPGHAVGAVGAQSIGEPGTQMTLKTFHFAGVAGMSITQGVPRIKEIINASKVISTPVITCVLANPELEQAARIVKGHIEKTYLRDILAYVEDVWYATGSYLSMRVDMDAINRLQLGITMHDVERAIKRSKGLKLEGSTIAVVNNHVRVYVSELDDNKKSRTATSKKKKDEEYFVRVQNMKRALPDVVVKGYPQASRAIIKRSDKANKRGIHEMELLVEGYGLKLCMTTEGVNGYKTVTNSVLEMRDVLGIEAARTTIIREIKSVMSSMNIDPRHMQLLADVMTYKGDVLGITRFGLAKMRDSVLQLASFEKTPDHLFDAAFHMKTDRIEGVSECIIMGQSMKIGTGAMQVYRRLDGMEKMCREETPFMDAMKPFLETGWLASM